MVQEDRATAIENGLTLEIVRGRYAAGSRLPSIRELAQLHDVTPATIQRVVARLETRGLITARQGSGLRVNDPSASGDVSLIPFWLEAMLDWPERAVAVLRDFLELRRMIAARMLVRHREAILARAAELTAAAAQVDAASAQGLESVREADLRFARELLLTTGNIAALGVLNTMGRVLERLPVVAEAMYAEPERNVRSMLEVLQALVDGEASAEARIEASIAAVDEQTLTRLEALLHGRRRTR
jgi:DNA-binding FadR family transcriptional regulator